MDKREQYVGADLSTTPLSCGGFLRLQDGARRVRDLDAFLAVAACQSLDELMLEQELMLEVA